MSSQRQEEFGELWAKLMYRPQNMFMYLDCDILSHMTLSGVVMIGRMFGA